MISASIYILSVSTRRADTLLHAEEGTSRFGEPVAAEPVPRFTHSRRAPLVVLASFEHGKITHIAKGRKGVAAGTDLVRLSMSGLQELKSPIGFSYLVDRAPAAVRKDLERTLSDGGLVRPKTQNAIIHILRELDQDLSKLLERFSATRAQLIKALSRRQKANLALQKETLSAALEISGVGTDQILDWSPTDVQPPDVQPPSFLAVCGKTSP